MFGRAYFLAPVVDRAPGECLLCVVGNGRPLATKVLTAFDSPSRRRGLLGRAGIGEGEVLIIAPSSAVHTFRMQFPIDLVYADRDGRVLKLAESVTPNRLSGAWGAFCVIEMAQGAIAKAGLEKGDRLEFRKP
jgi:uncharacterized membrane protein (UPF0127 family)